MIHYTRPIRRAVGLVGDLLFPRSCGACDEPLTDTADAWCEGCGRELLDAMARPYCVRCGLDAGPYIVGEDCCPICQHRPRGVERIARVATYRGIMGRLIRAYKYAGRQHLDAALGDMLAAALAGRTWHKRLDALVPVPSHWTHRWERGFEPIALVAGRAAGRLDLSALPLLCRPKGGPHQIGLSQARREVNVRGVFVVRRHARVAGATLCLVDDVSATGATLREAARALTAAGASAVYAAVLAKVDPRDAQRLGT